MCSHKTIIVIVIMMNNWKEIWTKNLILNIKFDGIILQLHHQKNKLNNEQNRSNWNKLHLKKTMNNWKKICITKSFFGKKTQKKIFVIIHVRNMITSFIIFFCFVLFFHCEQWDYFNKEKIFFMKTTTMRLLTII